MNRGGRAPSAQALVVGLALVVGVALILIAIVAGLSIIRPTTTSTPTPTTIRTAVPTTTPAAASRIPDFAHVWILVMENTSYDEIVGQPDVPYLNELIARYGLADAYQGVARPSQPNYLAMFSGSTHGITDNDSHDLDAPSIADQIEASGRTWREHDENVPPDCFTGSKALDGRDGPGEYRRKHAPAISFTSIREDPRRCAFIGDFTAFQPGASDFAFLVPNQCHDAHDCPLAEADAWLASFVPRIIDSQAFQDGGVLFLTFDEGRPSDPGGGHIVTLVISPDVRPGQRSAVPHDHYSLLRTIQEAWGLDCLAESCSANTLAEFFPGP